MATAVLRLPQTKIDPTTHLPVGAPTPAPGESKAAYQKRLDEWLQKWVNDKVDKAPLGPLPALTNPITPIEDAIKRLLNADTWVRLSEIVVGVICIAVGLSAMTKANPVAKVAKAAVK